MSEIFPEGIHEREYMLEATARFYEIAQGVGNFYGLPKLAESSGIVFRTNLQREDLRSDTLRYPNAANGDFVFEVCDYGRFYEEFSSFLELNMPDPGERLRLTRDLYMGVGIANFVAERHISDPRVPVTKQRLDTIKKIFTKSDDIKALFASVLQGEKEVPEDQEKEVPEDQEIEVPLVKYVLDKEVMRTNGYRVGLRYLFDSMPDIIAPLDILTLQKLAKTAFRDLIDNYADRYVDISVFGFGKVPEQGEKTFIYLVPSWLMAMAAAPLKPSVLKDLHSPAWRR